VSKFAVILHAQPDDMPRALHALLYTKELNEAGHDVQLLFDGAGTTWIQEFEKPDFQYHSIYQDIKRDNLIAGACAYCSDAFQARDAISIAGVQFKDQSNGHPSIAQLVQEGYSLITL